MSTIEYADVRLPDVTEPHLSTDPTFDPGVCFDQWLQHVENFRNRERVDWSPGVLINGEDLDTGGAVNFGDQLAERFETEGTLVVAEHGKLEGNIEVTLALIDGVFKGNITATEGVVLENHAVVIGDIYTPVLTIRGGGIIEGKCQFVEPREKWAPPVWSVLKDSLARVWRGRIFS